jgi:hypothetical protein
MERSELNENDLIITQPYEECSDGHRLIMKSTKLSICFDTCHNEKTIDSLMELICSCVSKSMAIVFRFVLSVSIHIGKNFGDPSVSRITSRSPEWWTPTGMLKAILCLMVGQCLADT